MSENRERKEVPESVADAYREYKKYLEHKQTNGDRIRSMTDEKLAEYFSQEVWQGQLCFSCPAEKECSIKEDCRSCFLDWLKQEVKE